LANAAATFAALDMADAFGEASADDETPSDAALDEDKQG
jgi:hypothetical protein